MIWLFKNWTCANILYFLGYSYWIMNELTATQSKLDTSITVWFVPNIRDNGRVMCASLDSSFLENKNVCGWWQFRNKYRKTEPKSRMCRRLPHLMWFSIEKCIHALTNTDTYTQKHTHKLTFISITDEHVVSSAMVQLARARGNLVIFIDWPTTMKLPGKPTGACLSSVWQTKPQVIVVAFWQKFCVCGASMAHKSS